MTVLRRIGSWFSTHWSMIRQKPVNGEYAISEIEPILKEMRSNNKRVSKAVEKLVDDTATCKRMMADGTIVNNNRS